MSQSPHPDRGVRRGAQNRAGSIGSTTTTNGKAGGGGKDGKGKREQGQGRGPTLGGDPGSASRVSSRAPPTKDNAPGFLPLALPGHAPLRRPSPGLFSAGTRRAQPSRASLTPEEALAPSSSSPLQADDVELTARSQKVAPSGARSPRTAVETQARVSRSRLQL